MNRLRQKKVFVVQDADGEKYTIYEYVEHGGRKRLLTEDGDHVNYIEKGKYLLVKDNLSLYSDSPDAP